MNGTRLNTNSVQVKLKINCNFIVNNAMWLQKNKEELKKLKTWDETPIHVIPNVMVIQVLQCKLSPSSYIVGKWVVMTCVTSARYSRHTHTQSRDRGFLEGLLCIVPKRHFRISPYEEQYGDILYVFAIQDKMIFSMSQGSKDRLRQRHSPRVPPVFQNVGKVITSGYYQHPHNHGINGILHILQHPQTAIENPVI